MSIELKEIISSQTAWAERHGIPFDGTNRCRAVEQNLFMPLMPRSHEEFGHGAGSELGTPDDPGSMASLRSSSALAVNVFDAWRDADPGLMGPLVGADRAVGIRFEVQYPTGLGGVPPHLDVVMDQSSGVPLAIESKFAEVYSPAHNAFRSSYFDAPGLWEGFTQTRQLASAVADGSTEFDHLGAAQLVKHALGLKRAHGPNGFKLLYLWYEWPGEIAAAHRREIESFAEAIGDDFDFTALTHQELFDALRRIPQPRLGYVAYLEGRYFSDDPSIHG